MNPQQKAQRLPLFHAIAIALFAATSEQAFATELEQEAQARARVAEIVDQLPDLGSEPGTNKTAASDLAQKALGFAMSSVQGADADSLANGLANEALEAGVAALADSDLPFLGQLQGGLSYDSATGKFVYDLLAIDAFLGKGDAGHHLLGQVGLHNHGDRPTANLGVVYRWINAEQSLMLGGNVFLDHAFKGGANRLGVGVEAVSGNLRAFSNVYAPIDDTWTVSPKNGDIEERPAQGIDLGFAWTPSSMPALDLQLKGARWSGDAVDVFGSGQTERDPTVYAAKVEYSPVPLFSASIEHAQSNGGQKDTSVGVRFTYQFGVPLAQQMTSKGNAKRNSVSLRALAPVEREKRIVMETREREVAPPVFAGPSLMREEIVEGNDYLSVLDVSGGAPSLTYALSGADAHLFALVANQLQLAARDYDAPTDADVDNVYDVTVTVADARGRTAQKQFQVVVVEDRTDTDDDGLTNKEETHHKTDPAKPDTDGDGLTDKAEIDGGTDPLDPNDPGLAGPGTVITAVEVQLLGGRLDGHPLVGATLMAKVVCTRTCTGDFGYQWERETAPGSGVFESIPGATKAAYTTVRTDQRRALRVQAWRALDAHPR